MDVDRRARRALAADATLGQLVEPLPLQRLQPAPSFFARFVRSVIRQQISMDAAAAIERRLHETVGSTPHRDRRLSAHTAAGGGAVPAEGGDRPGDRRRRLGGHPDARSA
ncbi:UNVERIFIED_CONTAM: hypothetical protein BEN50_24440 [Euhalothece sp. KZN 001]